MEAPGALGLQPELSPLLGSPWGLCVHTIHTGRATPESVSVSSCRSAEQIVLSLRPRALVTSGCRGPSLSSSYPEAPWGRLRTTSAPRGRALLKLLQLVDLGAVS